ncbi:hypothetical protein [Asanoa iriomotensis]|uniref:Uncharacterized protein n=1 Tax=Asanoa iriomotensis TaxID=234613 RepID=A0ABQ4CEB0_9ACTN|nr:hypothetical protein [Asanoa iriomotensis]GIF61115.1 hypothetical protein Air01nite_72100 [Asanoa iriomotensis]
MLSRRIRMLVLAAVAVPLAMAGSVAAVPVAAAPAAPAPVQPAPPAGDYTDPHKGSHLRLGLLVSDSSATPTILEIDRGFTSSLRGSSGPFTLRLRDSAGAVLDTLTADDPLALRAYDSKQNVHRIQRLKEADVVVDLPFIDTTVTVEVVLDRRRIATIDVSSLIQGCQGKPLPCAVI